MQRDAMFNLTIGRKLSDMRWNETVITPINWRSVDGNSVCVLLHVYTKKYASGVPERARGCKSGCARGHKSDGCGGFCFKMLLHINWFNKQTML